jgi:hypothetical protein
MDGFKLYRFSNPSGVGGPKCSHHLEAPDLVWFSVFLSSLMSINSSIGSHALLEQRAHVRSMDSSVSGLA